MTGRLPRPRGPRQGRRDLCRSLCCLSSEEERVNEPPKRVLVTDFDGTMTRHDFFRLAVERLTPPITDYWQAYRTGGLSHFEALRAIYATIRAGEAEVLAVVRDMELDPDLPAALAALRAAGWRVVVAS